MRVHVLLATLSALSSAAAEQNQVVVRSAQYRKLNDNSEAVCYIAQTGGPSSRSHHYNQTIAPRVARTTIVIPNYQGCTKMGVLVSVCERVKSQDVVRLVQFEYVEVQRGDLPTPADLDLDVYCA